MLLLLGMFTRDAFEHTAILESFKPAALDQASPDGWFSITAWQALRVATEEAPPTWLRF